MLACQTGRRRGQHDTLSLAMSDYRHLSYTLNAQKLESCSHIALFS